MNTSAPDILAEIENAAHAGAFGANRLPTPTPAQCVAGNYKVGRVEFHGFPLSIEQPRGSYRSGTDKNGQPWHTRLDAHYGYFTGTKGADGDPVDCFIGVYPNATYAYVINQAMGGRFDEHKVMLGFPDESSARQAYLNSFDRGWSGLDSIVQANLSQLRWWLKHGNKSRPLLPKHLPYAGIAMPRTYWDANAQPENTTLDRLLYDLRREEPGLMMDSVSLADIYEDAEGRAVFDALVTPLAQLQRNMDVMKRVMDRAGEVVKVSAVQVSEPFTQKGSANVAAIFELSDGQTVSVYFHNPDTTPKKITPSDEVISWKWLLNKKDITIVVAPERGEDLRVNEVAKRIMRLAEKNSGSFQKANAKRADTMAAIEGLKAEIAGLEVERDKKIGELEAAKVEAEESMRLKGGDKHYSEKINDVLVAKHGWEHVVKGTQDVTASVSKNVGGNNAGGLAGLSGDRIVYAVWDKQRARYLALQAGFDDVFDMDGRDQDPDEFAATFDRKVTEWAITTAKDPRTLKVQDPEQQVDKVNAENQPVTLPYSFAKITDEAVDILSLTVGKSPGTYASANRIDSIMRNYGMDVAWSASREEVVMDDASSGFSLDGPRLIRGDISDKDGHVGHVLIRGDGQTRWYYGDGQDMRVEADKATRELGEDEDGEEVVSLGWTDPMAGIDAFVEYADAYEIGGDKDPQKIQADILAALKNGGPMPRDLIGEFNGDPLEEFGKLWDGSPPEIRSAWIIGLGGGAVKKSGGISKAGEKVVATPWRKMGMTDRWVVSGAMEKARRSPSPEADNVKGDSVLSQVPEQIQNRLKIALVTLRDVEKSLNDLAALEDKVGGNGRYQADLLKNRASEIAQANSMIEKFRKAAEEKGIDAEKVIQELGGIADISPRPEALAWLDRQVSAEESTQKATDRALFQAVADGDISGVAPKLMEGLYDEGLDTLLEAAYNRQTDDPDMMALFEKALDKLQAVRLAAFDSVGSAA